MFNLRYRQHQVVTRIHCYDLMINYIPADYHLVIIHLFVTILHAKIAIKLLEA